LSEQYASHIPFNSEKLALSIISTKRTNVNG
jgi:hypothetical protein